MARVIQDKGGREYMEDMYIQAENIVPGIHLYAVFDGHAGDKVAIFLRDNVPVFAKRIIPSSINLQHALFSIFLEVIKHIPKDIALHTGSTAVIMLQHGSTIAVANCGDSRAIMNDGDKAVAITEDHKPDREIERIMKAGGFVTANHMDVPRVHGQLAVSRSIGDFYLYPSVIWKPEISTIQVGPGNKYVIMATDGIWDAVTNQEAVDLMEDQLDTGLAMENAMDIAIKQTLIVARARGSTDNVTILAIPIQ